MEHKPLVELQQIADLEFLDCLLTDREQRLARWSKLLLANPERELRSLHEIEHLSASDRRACRSDDSPLSIAYNDPLLRSSGLKRLTGAEAAARLQAVIDPPMLATLPADYGRSSVASSAPPEPAAASGRA
jgi:hypothetical protein